MKNITLVNTDLVLGEELSKHYKVANDISENVFIDWYSPKDNIDQITTLEEAIKNKSNIIIFDRYLTLKQHEIDWLLRYKNVYLFEPSLITRRYFRYMPFWYKIYSSIDSGIEETERENVGFVADVNRNNVDRIYDVPTYAAYTDINMNVLFCGKSEYKCGYLPDMSEMLYNKCVPLVPGDHKYYWKLFQGLIINNKKDLDWCINLLRLYDALIFGIYSDMEKYFPEMLVENVVKQIMQTLDAR